MADPRQIEAGTRRRNLDRRVTWRERMETRSGRGAIEVTYTDHDVWAKRLDSDGTFEIIGGENLRREASRRYLMRFDSRIRALDFIRDEGQSFGVTGVAEIERRRWLLVEVTTG